MAFPSTLAISITAEPLVPGWVPWFTNSALVTLIVTILITLWARSATRKMELVPQRRQNVFEALVEALYNLFEGIVGKHMIAKTFPLIATLFIFILTANWFGLLPGVGTIGWGKPAPGLLALEEVHRPLIRPSNADLNMTVGMALFFMAWWLVWTISEVGVIGFLKHNFAPKGGMKGLLALMLVPIFLFVGCVEMISIAFRPVSLSLRLFGNMFAGETLLSTMSELGDGLPFPINFICSIVFPLPFYFLELLVGLLQAFVFALLCSVYIRLSTEHEEESPQHA
jgi:F-type H+-transporting ATPase subunit a